MAKNQLTTAEVRKLDDAPTPVQGTPIARMRHLTGAVTRRIAPMMRSRRNLWLVVAFCVAFGFVLALFILLSDGAA